MWIIAVLDILHQNMIFSTVQRNVKKKTVKRNVLLHNNIKYYINVAGCLASRPGAAESVVFGKPYSLMSQGHDLKVERNSYELSNYIIGSWHVIN